MRTVRLGTRGSRLALAQAQWVADRLRASMPGLEVRLEVIKTAGDRVQDRSLHQLGVQGAFTRELDAALLDGRVDAAVHSLKDMPTKQASGLAIAAVPEREDPRDAFIGARGARLAELPEGAAVGTGSLRRRAQLLALRPGLRVEPMRGNIDTRLRVLRESGALQGIILACAGLRRLGLDGAITEILDAAAWLPAPGQAALAVTARADDAETLRAIQALDHPPARAAVTAERAFLARLEAGCHAPVGAWARADGSGLVLSGLVAALDGRAVIRGEETGSMAEARQLGERLAEALLSRGATELLAEAGARRDGS